MNVTNTASAAASALIDLQVGGVSQFKVSKAGAVTAVGVAVPTISSSETLSNKTLSSPTLSGSVSGSPSFTGNPIFSGNPRIAAFNIGADSDIYVYESATDTLTFRAGGAGTETYFTIGPSNSLQLGGVAVPTVSSSDTLSNKTLNGVTIADATNIVLGSTTGTKIATSASQKLGFFNATPVVQPTAVANATNSVDVITQVNALLSRMRSLGLIAT